VFEDEGRELTASCEPLVDIGYIGRIFKCARSVKGLDSVPMEGVREKIKLQETGIKRTCTSNSDTRLCSANLLASLCRWEGSDIARLSPIHIRHPNQL